MRSATLVAICGTLAIHANARHQRRDDSQTDAAFQIGAPAASGSPIDTAGVAPIATHVGVPAELPSAISDAVCSLANCDSSASAPAQATSASAPAPAQATPLRDPHSVFTPPPASPSSTSKNQSQGSFNLADNDGQCHKAHNISLVWAVNTSKVLNGAGYVCPIDKSNTTLAGVNLVCAKTSNLTGQTDDGMQTADPYACNISGGGTVRRLFGGLKGMGGMSLLLASGLTVGAALL